MAKRKLTFYIFFMLLFGGLLFIPFLGQVHLFDWDEINFAEAAREMIVTGNYFQVQIDYQPFWEKPPLFFWLQAGSMQLFGINEFAARFPNAIAGIATLFFLFLIGNKLFGRKFGIIWAIVYAGSILPHLYFKSGIIDPWFNLFIFSGIYFTWLGISEGKSNVHYALAGMLIGLAVLTKGPVGLGLYGLIFLIYFIFRKFHGFPKYQNVIIFILMFLLFGGIWFSIELFNGRTQTLVDFFTYQVRLFETQDAGHGGPFYYHFLVILFGCFPASWVAFMAFTGKKEAAGIFHFRILMIISLFAVLLVFSIVKTKIVHYSSLAYFPVTYLAAWIIHRIRLNQINFRKFIKICITLIALILGMAFLIAPFFLSYYKTFVNAGIPIPDEVLDYLSVHIKWSFYDLIPGLILIAGAMILILAKNQFKATIALFIAVMISVNLIMLLIVPKIEKVSQGAAIDFYVSKQKEKCYIIPLGFKSYAHLFYTKKQLPDHPQHNDKDWLLNGDIDLPAYFVIKNKKARKHESWFPQLEKVEKRNGFSIYRRLPEGEEYNPAR